jgi:transcriptional regulator with XRE-family HTH domain
MINWDKIFRTNVRRFRLERRLTGKELMILAGVSPGYGSLIENATPNGPRRKPAQPTLETILSVAAALRVEPAELFAKPPRGYVMPPPMASGPRRKELDIAAVALPEPPRKAPKKRTAPRQNPATPRLAASGGRRV